MAFTTDNLVSGGDIEVIIRKDTAINHEACDYNKYLESLDEADLVFKDGEEPTKFLMKKNIPLKHKIKIDNTKVQYERTGDVRVNLGSLTIETVRASLCGIKNPDSVPQEKQLTLKFHDGLLDEKITEALISADIIDNLYQARENYLKKIGGSPEELKKE